MVWFLPHTYLRWEGEFVELHHLVHVLWGREGVTTRHPEAWPPPQSPLLLSLTGLTVMAPGHEDVLEPTVGLVHAKLCAAGRDRG